MLSAASLDVLADGLHQQRHGLAQVYERQPCSMRGHQSAPSCPGGPTPVGAVQISGPPCDGAGGRPSRRPPGRPVVGSRRSSTTTGSTAPSSSRIPAAVVSAARGRCRRGSAAPGGRAASARPAPRSARAGMTTVCLRDERTDVRVRTGRRTLSRSRRCPSPSRTARRSRRGRCGGAGTRRTRRRLLTPARGLGGRQES